MSTGVPKVPLPNPKCVYVCNKIEHLSSSISEDFGFLECLPGVQNYPTHTARHSMAMSDATYMVSGHELSKLRRPIPTPQEKRLEVHRVLTETWSGTVSSPWGPWSSSSTGWGLLGCDPNSSGTRTPGHEDGPGSHGTRSLTVFLYKPVVFSGSMFILVSFQRSVVSCKGNT